MDDEVLVFATGLDARFEAECAAAIPGWRPDFPAVERGMPKPSEAAEMGESADCPLSRRAKSAA